MIIGKPKPSRIDRKKQENDAKEALRAYRQSQYEIASWRDNGMCVFCKFIKGIEKLGDDIHHVYGRSNKSGKDVWKEGYQYLVTTCRDCHPQPIKSDNPSPSMQWIEDIRKKANEMPINKLFKHEPENRPW